MLLGNNVIWLQILAAIIIHYELSESRSHERLITAMNVSAHSVMDYNKDFYFGMETVTVVNLSTACKLKPTAFVFKRRGSWLSTTNHHV